MRERERESEGGSNRVVSVWARLVRWKGERVKSKLERERDKRGTESERASERKIRHNYRLMARWDRFSEGTPWTVRGGRSEAAHDSEKRCLFDRACGCFPTWQLPARCLSAPSASTQFGLNGKQIRALDT